MEEVEAVMIFHSGWTKAEIEGLTCRELFNYVREYRKLEAETLLNFFKTFAIYNLESTTIAMHGKKQDRQKYMNDIRKRNLFLPEGNEQSDMEEQFKGVDFE